MTKKELLASKLRKINFTSSGDTEADHGKADDLLLGFINDAEVNKAYDSIDKWYA